MQKKQLIQNIACMIINKNKIILFSNNLCNNSTEISNSFNLFFNDILKLGKFSIIFELSTILSFHKNEMLMLNCRPISITNIPSKLVEKYIKFCKRNLTISNSQISSRERLSTNYVAVNVTKYIYKSLDEEKTLGVSLILLKHSIHLTTISYSCT